MRLELDKLSKQFGTVPVLDAICLHVEDGEIACLLGASGCGKTTALRLIAGFETPDSGAITADGHILADARTNTPPHQRKIGMVFQDHALLPHLNVRQNVGLGLRRLGKAARSERVSQVLDLVGLQTYAARYPADLSGGQAQRVALARALAPAPNAILLDEPFSNLDVTLRERLVVEVRDILKAAGTTALLVTHDQNEAFAMADHVGVMNAGKIEQWATPYDLYHRPASRFVAGFVGEGELLRGTRDPRSGGDDRGTITTELGKVRGEQVGSNADDVDVLLRPDDIVLDNASPACGTIVRKAFRGAQTLYTLQLGSGARVLSLADSHDEHAVGDVVGLRLATEHVVTFAR